MPGRVQRHRRVRIIKWGGDARGLSPAAQYLDLCRQPVAGHVAGDQRQGDRHIRMM